MPANTDVDQDAITIRNRLKMVPVARFELARLSAGDFESPVATDYTTQARCSYFQLTLGATGLGFSYVYCTQPQVVHLRDHRSRLASYTPS